MKQTVIRAAWAFALLLLPGLLRAQTTSDGGSELRARASVGADYKIKKGLHLNLEQEVRMENNLGSLQRLQTTLGVDYKVNKYFKTGASYILIENYKNNKKLFEPYHRGRLYVQGTLPAGLWRFSLRETFQLTHRPGSMNTTQAPRNALALKTRLKAEYKGWKPVEPYAFLELRTALNDAAVNATYNTSTSSWSNYSFGGYGVVHNNRLRLGLGADWKITKAHCLTLYGLLDWCRNRDVDTARDSDDDDNSYYYLKSFNIEKKFNGTIGLSYKFSF